MFRICALSFLGDSTDTFLVSPDHLKAMDFMKVSSIPVPKSTGYETYFTKFGSQKNYYASLEEPEVGIEQIVPYIIFLVSPIFLVAFVALRKSFQL